MDHTGSRGGRDGHHCGTLGLGLGLGLGIGLGVTALRYDRVRVDGGWEVEDGWGCVLWGVLYCVSYCVCLSYCV